MPENEPATARLAVTWPDGAGGSVDVGCTVVPGTGGLFAVHRRTDLDPGRGGGPGRPWGLTHLPTGFSAGRFDTAAEAAHVGRQLYHAAPGAWRLGTADAAAAALPGTVSAWARAVNRACEAGVSPLLLRGYGDFARDLDSAALENLPDPV